MPRFTPCDPDRDCALTLGGGRRLTYRQYGAVDGTPVIALHGTPGSRLKFRPVHAAALARGLRLICPDRWSYGGTQAPTDPATLAGYAGDIAGIMRQLGLERAAVLGISGGGPFAATTAAVLGQRIERLALVAPVGRVDAGADVKMSVFHRFCFRMLPRIPGATRLIFEAYRWICTTAPAVAVSLSLLHAGTPDKRVMAPLARRIALGRTFAEGLRHGAGGAVCDLVLFSRPWGVDLTVVAAATCVWIGDTDRNVPVAAVIALADEIPRAELRKIPDQGHLWISECLDGVLDWLAS